MAFPLFTLLLSLCTFQVWASPGFANIKQYGQLASLSYGKSDQIQNQLALAKQPLLKQATLAQSQVSYFVTQLDGIQVVAIRGTANAQNVLVDLDINLKQDPHLGIQVHQGFANAAYAVFADIKNTLDKSLPVNTTGHSLGGAVAVLLGMYLQQEGFTLQRIITFGQPKVTNVQGTRSYSELPLTRVVTSKDIVPLVPPLSPMQIKEMDIYWHNGTEIILLEGDKYSLTSGIKSMMRATKIASVLPDESNLHAHKMQTYLELIELKLNEAKEVPYKMGINLFGLSID